MDARETCPNNRRRRSCEFDGSGPRNISGRCGSLQFPKLRARLSKSEKAHLVSTNSLSKLAIEPVKEISRTRCLSAARIRQRALRETSPYKCWKSMKIGRGLDRIALIWCSLVGPTVMPRSKRKDDVNMIERHFLHTCVRLIHTYSFLHASCLQGSRLGSNRSMPCRKESNISRRISAGRLLIVNFGSLSVA